MPFSALVSSAEKIQEPKEVSAPASYYKRGLSIIILR